VGRTRHDIAVLEGWFGQKPIGASANRGRNYRAKENSSPHHRSVICGVSLCGLGVTPAPAQNFFGFAADSRNKIGT
jgi:hypothetical protein